MTRRQIMKSAGVGAVGVAMGLDGLRAQDLALSTKALLFDTFGTVVDWRGSIVEEGTTWEKTRGVTVD